MSANLQICKFQSGYVIVKHILYKYQTILRIPQRMRWLNCNFLLCGDIFQVCDTLLLYFYYFSGYNLLRDPHHNKGLAFSEKERDAHYLRGLLPPTVVNQDLQVSLFWSNIKLRDSGMWGHDSYFFNFHVKFHACS